MVTFVSTLANLAACAWGSGACWWARWIPRVIFLIGLIAAVIVFIVWVIEAIASWEAGTTISWPCLFGAIVEFAYYSTLAYVAAEILNEVGCRPLPIVRNIPSWFSSLSSLFTQSEAE